MKVIIITLFPDLIRDNTSYSIIKRAIKNEIIEISTINPRDFTIDKHHMADDIPYGGGVGMVLKPEPFISAIKEAKKELPNAKVIALCPTGKVLNQQLVGDLANLNSDYIFVCGHYEGFDERIYNFVDERLSIGDYVLTGGELPALVVVEAIARFIPGVLGRLESATGDSFGDGLLEAPSYTRPIEYENMCVPPVLANGNHAKIELWEKEQSFLKTYLSRPELIANYKFKKGDGKIFLSMIKELNGDNNG